MTKENTHSNLTELQSLKTKNSNQIRKRLQPNDLKGFIKNGQKGMLRQKFKGRNQINNKIISQNECACKKRWRSKKSGHVSLRLSIQTNFTKIPPKNSADYGNLSKKFSKRMDIVLLRRSVKLESTTIPSFNKRILQRRKLTNKMMISRNRKHILSCHLKNETNYSCNVNKITQLLQKETSHLISNLRLTKERTVPTHQKKKQATQDQLNYMLTRLFMKKRNSFQL